MCTTDRTSSLFCRDSGLFARWGSAIFCLALAVFTAVGCGADTGSNCLSGTDRFDCQARMEIRDDSGAVVAHGDTVTWAGLVVGQSGSRTFSISNTNAAQNAARLTIARVEIVSPDKKAEVFCSANNQQPCVGSGFAHVVPVAVVSGEDVSNESFTISYTPADPAPRLFLISVFVDGDPRFQSSPFTFRLLTKEPNPRIDAHPAEVSLDWVPTGQSALQTVTIRNTGDDTLDLQSAEVVGGPGFSVALVKDTNWKSAGQLLTIDQPVAPGGSFPVQVRYLAVDTKARSAQLLLRSNGTNANVLTVPLVANAKAPCILVKPANIEFGATLVGQSAETSAKVCNCGAGVLPITDIELGVQKGDNDAEFALLKGTAPPFDLAVNGCVEIGLTYQPEDITPIDPQTTLPKYDKTTLRIQTKGLHRDVTVRGHGVDSTCPLAKAICKEGEEVIPQTLLHLTAAQSKAVAGGTINKWQWTVKKQPAGSVTTLMPSASAPDVSLAANVAGEYLFCLEVWDTTGQKSCAPSCTKVLVIPEEAIHVELLWKTPGDPDESDKGPGAGADLDLHFAHPAAGGAGPDLDCDKKPDPWFQVPFDAFWFNSEPNWASANKKTDDPGLDLDDTDGAGPENLNLDSPQGTKAKPMAYDVGVHYWRDHGWGESYAEIRVYIVGQLVWQDGPVKMKAWDMWHVGRVNWPNTMVGGTLEPFTPCYQLGTLCNPGKTGAAKYGNGKKWQPKGDRCMTPCYDPPNMPQFNGTPAHCTLP